MHETVYRVNRLNVAVLALFITTTAVVLASPWLTDYLRATELVGRLKLLNELGPDGKVAASYLLATLCAVAAVIAMRLMINPVALRLDNEGITATHKLGVQRGYWSEFTGLKTFGFGRFKAVSLRFKGKRSHRKVYLPFHWLGVDLKNFQGDLLMRLALSGRAAELVGETARPVAGAKPPGSGAGPVATPRTRQPFGRRAAQAVATKPTRAPVVQEGFRLFGRRPAE